MTSTDEVLPVWGSFLFCFVFNRTKKLLRVSRCVLARTRLRRVYSRALAEASGHTPGEPAGTTRSYLQIIFRAEHVRISDADAPEGHRDKDRSLRLLPAVIANLQRHPERLTEPLGRWVRTRACSVAREAGVATRQPFRVRPGRGAPELLAASCPDCLGILQGTVDRFLGSYSCSTV